MFKDQLQRQVLPLFVLHPSCAGSSPLLSSVPPGCVLVVNYPCVCELPICPSALVTCILKTLCTCGLGGALLNICTFPARHTSET